MAAKAFRFVRLSCINRTNLGLAGDGDGGGGVLFMISCQMGYVHN